MPCQELFEEKKTSAAAAAAEKKEKAQLQVPSGNPLPRSRPESKPQAGIKAPGSSMTAAAAGATPKRPSNALVVSKKQKQPKKGP